MRELFTLLSVALIAGATLAFTSCSKDEIMTNKVTVEGVEYELIGAQVFIDGISENWEGYSAYFILIGEGLTFGGDFFVSGNGMSVLFNTFSARGNALDKGTYQWVDAKDDFIPLGSFDSYSRWSDSTSEGFFTKGSFKVKAVSGDQYEIQFSCLDENGKKITGYYKGTITFKPSPIRRVQLPEGCFPLGFGSGMGCD